jgi:hypothetical protein
MEIFKKISRYEKENPFQKIHMLHCTIFLEEVKRSRVPIIKRCSFFLLLFAEIYRSFSAAKSVNVLLVKHPPK